MTSTVAQVAHLVALLRRGGASVGRRVDASDGRKTSSSSRSASALLYSLVLLAVLKSVGSRLVAWVTRRVSDAVVPLLSENEGLTRSSIRLVVIEREVLGSLREGAVLLSVRSAGVGARAGGGGGGSSAVLGGRAVRVQDLVDGGFDGFHCGVLSESNEWRDGNLAGGRFELR